MREIRVQFLTFDGCPLAGAARESLDNAAAETGLAGYEEVDILDSDTPDELRDWGSPTILVNGVDVTGQPKGDSVSCRVYPGPSRVPSPGEIAARIRRVNDEQ